MNPPQRMMAPSWNEDHLLRDWSSPVPWPVYRVGLWVIRLLRWIETELIPPPLTLFHINMGTWRTQVLYTLASLGVADVLAAGPQTAEEVAAKLGGNAKEMYRVLRAAVQLGMLEVAKGCDAHGRPRFQNTKISALLRKDHPNCLKHLVTDMMDVSKQAWCEQPWKVLTGGMCFEKTHGGTGFWEWLEAHPATEDGFSKAMTEVDSLGAVPLTKDFNWNRFSRIIDIGGAYGSFLQGLLAAHKRPTGMLFDQPQVIKRAEQVWKKDEARSCMLDRVDFHSGDFFAPETIPAGRDGDVYLLRTVLHDWNDASCITILSNLRRAMGDAKATLIIAETAIRDEFNDPIFQRGLLDLHMQAVLDGAERNVQQWKELFSASGFAFSRITETRGVFSLVEAVPV